MYSKIMWCCVCFVTLLDVSLNSKFIAQGKNHDVTAHDSLIEGITFQEWGAESEEASASAEGGRVRLRPASLRFGRAALGAAHARRVSLTNLSNSTLHLASLAGTTHHFHADFFDSKTLPPGGNTTFTVVYLGRREGAVSAHLFIHTSLGLYKYPVSAVGVASEWEVWPLVGLRVPFNATLDPLLTMYNPTDKTVQVSEVYSSASWVQLELPTRSARLPAAGWALPPRHERALLRLRIHPPAAHTAHTHTAYVRIKADIPGGALVVVVEAGAGGAAAWSPLHLRLGTRGADDPRAELALRLRHTHPEPYHPAPRAPHAPPLTAVRCAALPPPAPPAPAPLHANGAHNGVAEKIGTGGVVDGSAVGAGPGEGARCAWRRDAARANDTHDAYDAYDTHDTHYPYEQAATLTLQYNKLWASVEWEHAHEGDLGQGRAEAWCSGWVRSGGAVLPYSVRLLPGTLRLAPSEIHFVSEQLQSGHDERVEVVVHNLYHVPVRVQRLEVPPHALPYVQVELIDTVVGAGARAACARVAVRGAARVAAGETGLRAELTLHTNVSRYSLPLFVYSGKLHIEWEWPSRIAERLDVGEVVAGRTVRVRARLHNPAPAPLCGLALGAALPRAVFRLLAAPLDCVPPGEWAEGELQVRAGRRGVAHGAVHASAVTGGGGGGEEEGRRVRVLVHVTLRAVPARHATKIHLVPLHTTHAAPYMQWRAALRVSGAARVLAVRAQLRLPPAAPLATPALTYIEWSDRDEGSSGTEVGVVEFAPEELCGQRCYTGLQPEQAEWAAWVARGSAADWLPADAALARERMAGWEGARRDAQVWVEVRTARAPRLRAASAVWERWPRLVCARRVLHAGLAARDSRVPLPVHVHNPSHRHVLLLQPRLHPAHQHRAPLEVADNEFCRAQQCAWAPDAFQLHEWRALSGHVREWGAGAPGRAPVLAVSPRGAVELLVHFAPAHAHVHAARDTYTHALATYLHIRNNLTILETVQVSGVGGAPQLEMSPRDAHVHVSRCVPPAAPGASRALAVRNVGAVPLAVRACRVGGAACEAGGAACAGRGFAVSGCARLALLPNATLRLHVAYTADGTLARTHAPLHVYTDHGVFEFTLSASVAAGVFSACEWKAAAGEWAMRTGALLLAMLLGGGVLALAALDAERLLRAARLHHARALRRDRAQPLDLNREPAIAAVTAAPTPPAAPVSASRRRRPPRRALSTLDPTAERRAFERWRTEMERRPDHAEHADRSSDESTREPDRLTLSDAESDPGPESVEYLASDATHLFVSSVAEADADEPPPSGEDELLSTGTDSDTPAGDDVARDHSPVDYDANADIGMEPTTKLHDTSPTCGDVDLPLHSPELNAEVALEERQVSPPCVERHVHAKDAARRDKPVRRRLPPASAPLTPPSTCPPPRPATPATPAHIPSCATGSVRWGATWSSVVAAKELKTETPPLAPIGSSMRRRGDAGSLGIPESVSPASALPAVSAVSDHSLFYFNGAAALSTSARPPPALDYAWPSHTHTHMDFIGGSEETPAVAPRGGYGSIGSVWGSTGVTGEAGGEDDGGGGARAAWLWGRPQPCIGDVSMRPPPGFSSPSSGGGAGGSGDPGAPVRAFDPFQSLSSIWAPTPSPAPAPATPAWRRDPDLPH